MAHCLQRDKDYFIAAFSRETMQAKRIQNAIFGMLKEKNCQSRILQPAKEIDKQTLPKANRKEIIVRNQ